MVRIRNGRAQRYLLLALLLCCGPARAYTTDTMPQVRNSPFVATPERLITDPHAGSVGYRYEIDVPPGTAGMTPKLVLTYSSLNQSTPYGRGWNLNFDWIERGTATELPVYDDPTASADTFTLAGDILVQDGTSSDFRTSHSDGSRIRYHSSDPGTGYSNYWEVTRTDGTKYLYGSTLNSRLTRNDATAPETYRWALAEVIDLRGNSYRIEYIADTDVADTIIYSTFIYPHRIYYSLHRGAGAMGALQARRMVQFEWEERGSSLDNYDWPTSYRAGFKVQQRWRLARIVTGIDSSGNDELQMGTSEVTRYYDFEYTPKTMPDDPATADEDESRNPPFSQLRAIQRYGRGPASPPFLSKTTFEYTRPARGFAQTPVAWAGTEGRTYIRGSYTTPTGQALIRRTIIDMNGDGIADLLEVDTSDLENPRWLVAYGTPNGFGPQQSWLIECVAGSTTATCPDADLGYISFEKVEGFATLVTTDVFDIDGDGLPDRVTASGGPDGWRVWPNVGGRFGAPTTWANGNDYTIKARGVSEWSGYETRTTADVDGDGLPDLRGPLTFVNSGSGFEERYSGPAGGGGGWQQRDRPK